MTANRKIASLTPFFVSGPVSQLQRRFEQVKLLPRKDQEFVLKFLDTVLERRQNA